MARCEIHTRAAEAALRRLLPYLLVKRDQALLLLDFCSFKAQPKRGSVTYAFPHRMGGPVIATRRCFSWDQLEEMESFRARLLAMHEGATGHSGATDQLSRVCDSGETWTSLEGYAYLAGIMDSDGSFRVEKRNVERMLAPHYRINVRASQVIPSPAIELLAKTFGGRVAVKRSNRPGQRDLMTWSLHDRSAARAVEALHPYLVVKGKEALLLLKLRQAKAQGKQGLTEWAHKARGKHPVRMPKRCYSPEQVEEFERIYKAVQLMHSGDPRLENRSSSDKPVK